MPARLCAHDASALAQAALDSPAQFCGLFLPTLCRAEWAMLAVMQRRRARRLMAMPALRVRPRAKALDALPQTCGRSLPTFVKQRIGLMLHRKRLDFATGNCGVSLPTLFARIGSMAAHGRTPPSVPRHALQAHSASTTWLASRRRFEDDTRFHYVRACSCAVTAAARQLDTESPGRPAGRPAMRPLGPVSACDGPVPDSGRRAPVGPGRKHGPPGV